jgi:threonine/homoserine/homoserine lactone efflux protein
VIDVQLSGPQLATFMLATLAVMATPGVTVSTLLGNTLAYGVRAGFAVEAGAVIGRLSMIAILALGLGAVSTVMGALFDPIKYAGAVYLVWLGLKMIRHPPVINTGAVVDTSNARQIIRGVAVLWSNPKAFIFFGAFIPQFVDASGNAPAQILFLGAIWVVTAVTTDSCYILLAGSARQLFRGDFAKRLGWVSGSVLIGAGIWLAMRQKA